MRRGGVRWGTHRPRHIIFVAATLILGCGARSGLSGSVDAGGDLAEGDAGGPETDVGEGPDGDCSAPEPVELATGQDSAYHLSLDATRVYWGANRAVMAVEKCGGEPTTLVQDEPGVFDVSVSGPYVLWTLANCAGAVRRAGLDGSAPTTLSPAPGGACSQPDRVRAADGEAFWSQNDGAIRAVPVEGGAPRVVVSDGAAGALAMDDDFVYFTWAGVLGGVIQIARVPRSGGEPEPLALVRDYAYGLAVDDASVYWTDRIGCVERVGKEGGDPLVLWEGSGIPLGIVVDAQRVYFTTHSAGQVISVPKDGGGPTVHATGQEVAENIAVDESSIYWLSFRNETVMRVSK